MNDPINQSMQRRKDSPNGAGHYHIADHYPFPPGDVNLDMFRREPDFTTSCPIKKVRHPTGNFVGSGEPIQRAAWSYENPVDYSKMIAQDIGFDQSYATIEISPA